MNDPVFVFGSNLAGRHGRGAALWAVRHRGAIYGQGIGRQGNSYAIPTKDEALTILPMDRIAYYVDGFLTYARAFPDLQFELTQIGCGLAKYTPADIAPLFRRATPNVLLPADFKAVLEAAG